MKRNKIMALTALLTLIGAPLSKAQEKGGSQQSTSAQSSKDKTKEQNKNLEKTKDFKAPQQAKDSKNPQQTKGQTKDSKKGGKNNGLNNKSEANLVNRMTSLGYSIEWIKKNWPWLAAMGGTNLVTGVVGNKMGKNANVDAKIQQKIADKELFKAEEVEAKAQELAGDKKYTDANLADETFLYSHGLLTKNRSDAILASAVDSVVKDKIKDGVLVEANNEGAVKLAAANFGIKHTDAELETKANELAKGKMYTEVDLNDDDFLLGKNLVKKDASDKLVKDAEKKVNDEWNQRITNNELVQANDELNIKKVASEKFGIKHTDADLNDDNFLLVKNLVKKDASDKLVKDAKKKVNDEWNQRITNNELVQANDKLNIKKVASEKFGIKYTESELNQKIAAALSVAKDKGLLYRHVNNNVKKSFDDYVQKLDQKLKDSLALIQKKLGRSFLSTLCYAKIDGEYIENNGIVDSLHMIADIKNALVDKQAVNFEASFASSDDNQNDNAWSDFKFELGSKKYDVYIKHTENTEILVDVDNKQYSIQVDKDIDLDEDSDEDNDEDNDECDNNN